MGSTEARRHDDSNSARGDRQLRGGLRFKQYDETWSFLKQVQPPTNKWQNRPKKRIKARMPRFDPACYRSEHESLRQTVFSVRRISKSYGGRDCCGRCRTVDLVTGRNAGSDGEMA